MRFQSRGKSIKTNQWYYGYYFKKLPFVPHPFSSKAEQERYENETEHWIIVQESGDWGLPYSNGYVTIDPTTLGQCTGMHVKTTKGRREYLYEGDIVDFYNAQFEVVWDKDSFRWLLVNGTVECHPLVVEMVEVIVKVGNKYDIGQVSD